MKEVGIVSQKRPLFSRILKKSGAYQIVVASCIMGQLVTAPSLDCKQTFVANSATHGQLSSSPILSPKLSFTTASGINGQLASSPTLESKREFSVNSCIHGQLCSSPIILLRTSFSTNSAINGQFASSPSLSPKIELTSNSGINGQLASSPSIGQKRELSLNSCIHGQLCSSSTISQEISLLVDSGISGQLVSESILGLIYLLSPDSPVNGQIVSSPSNDFYIVLFPDDSIHGQLATSPIITGSEILLIVHDAIHGQYSSLVIAAPPVYGSIKFLAKEYTSTYFSANKKHNISPIDSGYSFGSKIDSGYYFRSKEVTNYFMSFPVTRIVPKRVSLLLNSGTHGQLSSSPTLNISSWDPTSITGCKLWLDASQIVGLSDGDPVGTWSDLSGLDNHFTQSIAINKPTYKTNILNTLPAVRSALGDSMTSTGASLIAVPANTNAFTVFSVYTITWPQAWTSWNTSEIFGWSDNTEISSFIFQAIHASWANSYRRKGSISFDNYSINNVPVLDTNPYYSVMAHDSVNELPLLRIRGTDKVTTWTQKGNASQYTMGTAITKAQLTGNVPSDYTDLFEIIVYDTYLSSTNIGIVEDYLKAKYGL